MYKTKDDFEWKGTTVKAGAPIQFRAEDDVYFVRPSYFPAGSIDRHDATYYGCRVNPSNVERNAE